MANPIQQGLKHSFINRFFNGLQAAMANPIQQGLKQALTEARKDLQAAPQWLIQYNKD